MQNDLLSTADALPDRELLDRLPMLAANERAASVELVAHLAALEKRPSLYAAGAYRSLFAYCTEALRLSEDAAYTRVTAAQACRRFPQMFDLLAADTLTLTSVRLIGPHLTAENHQDVIARAAHKSVAEVKRLVAELAPQPDARSLVRKLPAPASAPPGRVQWRSTRTRPCLLANPLRPPRKLPSHHRGRHRPRLFGRSRPSATACSSRWIRRPRTSSTACRRCCAARSPAATRA